MYSVTGTTIRMTRGDTLIISVGLSHDGETYTPDENDSIRFIVCRRKLNTNKTAYEDPTVLIEKAIPVDSMILRLDPNDTKALEFGTYAYDMEITFADGRIDTFIEGQKFIISPEVD